MPRRLTALEIVAEPRWILDDQGNITGVEDNPFQVVAAAAPGVIVGTVRIDQSAPGVTNKVVSDVPTATPTAYNVTLTLANTEYSQALPVNCRSFEFQARTEAILRFAFVTSKVAGSVAPFLTLKAADYYYSPPLNQATSPSTLFVASPTAGTVVEILAWT